MDTANFMITLEKYFMFYQGLSLVILCPFLMFISQASAALREIAINSRKEEFTGATDYKVFEWLSYILFFLSWFSLVFGIIFILKASWPA